MKVATTADRLKQLMDERGLKQVDILQACQPHCERLGVKLAKNDLSQYVSGKSKPGQDKLTILGLALNVDEAWLMGYSVPRKSTNINVFEIDNIIPVPKARKTPLLGTIACGEPILAVENIEDNIDIPEHINADFALRCKGDSMINSRIYDGDIVYIRQQPDVNNGDIAAVLIDDEATLKRVYKSANQLILQAENPAYTPMVFTEADGVNIRILGKAVGFTSKI